MFLELSENLKSKGFYLFVDKWLQIPIIKTITSLVWLIFTYMTITRTDSIDPAFLSLVKKIRRLL